MDIQTLFDHFDEQFVATGEITPAHGRCFVHRGEDVCAVVYRDKTRLYYGRRDGFEDRPQWPCFYRQCEVFTHGR